MTRMAEYIERDYVLKLLGVFNDRVHGDYHFMNGIETAKEIVEDAPSADVQPVKHCSNLNVAWSPLFECSICHWKSWDTYDNDTSGYNYCPNCGAKLMVKHDGT